MTDVRVQTPEYALALAPGTLIRDQYRVLRVLGRPGGFGITYLAHDVHLDTRMAIKEFLPRDLAGRGPDRTTVTPHSADDRTMFKFGLEQFVREARMLVKVDHSNIVRVRHFFEANGTAYLVMDYHEGRALSDQLRKMGGRMPHQVAVDIVLRVLDGLAAVHSAGILHRDIKPENIYLRANGQPLILDFGAARQAIGEKTRNLTAVLTPGFAPVEQYARSGKQGTWTDVYACAAVLYQCITGHLPPDAPTRLGNPDALVPPKRYVPELPDYVSDAILSGLAMREADRPQTATAFQDLLEGTSVEAPTSREIVAPPPPAPPPPAPPPVPHRSSGTPSGAGVAYQPSGLTQNVAGPPPLPVVPPVGVSGGGPAFPPPLTQNVVVPPPLPFPPAIPGGQDAARQAAAAPRPWRRWFARGIDQTILFWTLIFTFSGMIAALGIGETDEPPVGLIVLLLLLLWLGAIPFLALMTATMGTTIGKAILGLRVRTRDGQKLSFGMAFEREVRVWFFGMGMGVVPVNLITMLVARGTLEEKGRTSWDEALDTDVLYR